MQLSPQLSTPTCSRPARLSRRNLTLRAFLETPLVKAATCIPTPFFKAQTSDCPAQLVADETRYRGSSWANDLLPACTGPSAFQAVDRLASAYTHSGGVISTAADEGTQDAFLFFNSDLVNTGRFGSSPPTHKHSHVMGLYRVHVNRGVLEDVWLFRSGTEEERQHLLRPDVLAAHPLHHSSGSTSSGQLSLAPCTWVADHTYAATILSNASTWTHDVMSQVNLSSLLRVAAPDMTVHDGTGLMHEPLQGAACVGHHLVDQVSRCEFMPRVMEAQAMETGGNKVFQHWSQARTCRTTGQRSEVQGASLLVFDSKARIQQVVEFTNLDSTLFNQESAAQLLNCWEAQDQAAGGVSVAAARAAAEAQRLAEEAECLARQEREWMNW